MNGSNCGQENSKKELYSYHTFLFPFRWDCCSKNNSRSIYTTPYQDRLDIKKFSKALTESQSGWSYTRFEIKDNQDFNEYVYFYDYVRDAIYNKQKISQNQTSYYFKYEHKKGDCYNIYIKERNEPYQLEVDEISIKAYDTGVAILQFSLQNYKYPCPDDVLKINDFGRRIYPQFLGKGKKGINVTKNKFYADSISIGAEPDFSERSEHGDDSGYYDYPFKTNLSGDQGPIKLRKFISDLLGDRFKNRSGEDETCFEKGDVLIKPVIDDRMFVVCWYGNDSLAPTLKPEADTIQEKRSYTENDFWYKFLFVDGKDKGCASKIMEKELLKKHTYVRWIKYGTLYGMTRYSFMALTDKKDFALQILLPHIQTIYSQIMILALAQRASILKFSDEVAHVSSLKDRGSDKISVLYKNYIKFVNKIYFREVTAQEQGIDLYDMLLDNMRIKEDIKDLDNEIEELHNYASLMEEKKTNQRLTAITIIGFFFLAPTFITGFFGMNIFPDDFFREYKGGWWIEWMQKSCAEPWIYIILYLFPIAIIFYLCCKWRKNRLIRG